MATLFLALEIRQEINLVGTKVKKIEDQYRNENDENIQGIKRDFNKTGEKVNALIEEIRKERPRKE